MSSRSAYRVLSATWTPYVEHSFLYTPRIGDAEPSSVPKGRASSLLRLLAGDLGLTAAGRARLGVTAAPPAGADPYFD